MNDKKILKFAFVGILNMLFNYVIFSAIFFVSDEKELSVTLAFIISILFNYYTIGSFVFKSSHSAKKIAIFGSIYIFIYILNLIHLFLTVDFYGLNVYFSQFLTLLYLPALSYVLNQKYTFAKHTTDLSPPMPGKRQW